MEDARTWLELRLQDQVLRRYDAVLDVGGGDTPFTKLIQELPFIEEQEADGILVVVVHVVGPERADVDYLQAFASAGVLEAKATLILLNGGLVMGGKSVGPAFQGIVTHPAVVSATDRDAHVLTFPALSCMSEVTDRKLTFREAATGVVKDGMAPMMRFDRTRLRHAPPDMDAIDPDALDAPAVLSGTVQQRAHRLRVVGVGGRDQGGQHEAQRAGQHVALDAAHQLVAIDPAWPLLRAGGDALAVQDRCRRLSRAALLRTHRAREQGGDVGPQAVSAEAVVPAPHGLPGRTPGAGSARDSRPSPDTGRR